MDETPHHENRVLQSPRSFGINLEADVYEAIRRMAQERHVSRGHVVREIVREALTRAGEL